MSDSSAIILDYRVRKPMIMASNPSVLFLLHGYGSHEEDLFSFANYLPDDYLVISLRAPISLDFGGFAWYSIHFDQDQKKWSDDGEAIAAQKIILHNIDFHLKQFSLGDKKVSLLGFHNEVQASLPESVFLAYDTLQLTSN